MLSFARDVALVLDLKCLDGAADIHVGHGLDRIANTNICDFGPGLVRSGRTDGNRHHVNDVDLVPDKLLEVEWTISRMAKVKRDRLTSAYSLEQGDSE